MLRWLAAAWAVGVCTIGTGGVSAQASSQRVSLGFNGRDADSLSIEPVLSENGRFLAYQSFASNLVQNDTNGCSDVFLFDRNRGSTIRVSVSSGGAEGNYYSGEPAISKDGRFVAFVSEASTLVPGDTNGVSDVFVHDTRTRRTQRVSVSTAGFEGNRVSRRPAISADGRFVAFTSEATNLVRDDRNGVQDVFIRDCREGTTTRITAGAVEPDGDSSNPSISGDGRLIAFVSRAAAFAQESKFDADVFVFDRTTRKATLVSADLTGAPGGGEAPAISRDGSVIAFESAGRLVTADTNADRDVYAYRTASQDLVLASVSSEGACGRAWHSATESGVPLTVAADSVAASVSDAGRYLVFVSRARGLVPAETSGTEVYLRDMVAGTTRCLTLADVPARKGATPCVLDPILGVVDCPSLRAVVSGDGSFVAFHTRGKLSTGDSNACEDVYVTELEQRLLSPRFK